MKNKWLHNLKSHPATRWKPQLQLALTYAIRWCWCPIEAGTVCNTSSMERSHPRHKPQQVGRSGVHACGAFSRIRWNYNMLATSISLEVKPPGLSDSLRCQDLRFEVFSPRPPSLEGAQDAVFRFALRTSGNHWKETPQRKNASPNEL